MAEELLKFENIKDDALIGIIEVSGNNPISLTGFLPAPSESLNGDIRIIKHLINDIEVTTNGDTQISSVKGDPKYQYTGYVYSADLSAWKALDGNYSAENVFFDNDLTYTANIGVLTVGSGGNGVINAAGKSVKDVFNIILAKEKAPSVTKPSIGLTLSTPGIGWNQAVEVGTMILPTTWTVKFNKGLYSYGPNDTEVSCISVYIRDINGDSGLINENSIISSSITSTSGTWNFGPRIADDGAYRVAVSAVYTSGTVPNSNIGNEVPSAAIKSGLATTSSYRITSYRKWFLWTDVDGTAEINSDTIRANAVSSGNAKLNPDKAIHFSTVIPTCKRVILALPAFSDGSHDYNAELIACTDVDGFGLPMLKNFTDGLSAMNIAGNNNYAPVNYKVYVNRAEEGKVINTTTYDFIISAP